MTLIDLSERKGGRVQQGAEEVFVERSFERQWHAMGSDEVARALESEPGRGLSNAEVVVRLERFGPNVLTPSKGHGPLVRFLLQFHQPLLYILLAASAVTLVLKEYEDSAVIFGVVLINAIVGFIQESKAVAAISALAKSVKTDTTVLREGRRQRIPAEELVPGDIVILAAGDKIPADMRILSAHELHTDESVLTGESLPVLKRPEPIEGDVPLADRHCLSFAMTLVTRGQGSGVVVATGDRTEVGHIAELISGAQELATPLTRKISRFSRWLLYVIMGLAAATFAIGIARGETAVDMFMAAVALAVGAIPEGLPAAVTIMLSVGVARMAKRGAIIRKLPAVETLGSTTVICSDKTGTLTENQMTVKELYAGGRRYGMTGIGYSPEGEVVEEGAPAVPLAGGALAECLRAGALCNDATLVQKEGRWMVEGDPTEGALLASARKGGIPADELERHPHIDVIPFDSAHKFMATMHSGGEGRDRVVYLKGAVEAIMPKCSSAIDSGGAEGALDETGVVAQAEAMASRGLRVLAFAKRTIPAKMETLATEDAAGGCVFLGLQAMQDPPRAESTSAVLACRGAGIRVKMITGDHAATAAAIAGQIGLVAEGEDGEGCCLTGQELSALSEVEFVTAAEKTSVFARVAPEQKLRLVEALQSRGHVVAMTGDGVNDAPALKRADIGVAMGISGTDVAKGAADMVLTDDNFATIEAAVEEGRAIFENLTKFIVWTLPTNMGEGFVIMAAIAVGTALPILPVQILWINMTTAVLLGLMLVFEPKEVGIMKLPPRDPKVPIVTGELLRRLLIVSVLLLAGAFGMFKLELLRGTDVAVARTVAVNVFVIVETFYLFNCRSLTGTMFRVGFFSNPWVLYGSAAMIVLQLLFTYTQVMNRLFHSAPISLSSWFGILGFGLLAYLLVEGDKWLLRRVRARRSARRSRLA